MRTIFYIIQKEFIQVFRNKTMLPMIFMLPLVQMLILVPASTYDLKSIDVYVVDNDFTQTSKDLISRFEASPFFRIKNTSFDLADAENSFEKDETDFILEIPANFERTLVHDDEASVQLLINAIDGNKASLIYAYAFEIISGFNKGIIAEWKGMPGFDSLKSIDARDNYWFNPELGYSWFMASGILGILVTIIGMFLSGMNLVREKEIGTIEQLNVTPIKKYQFIFGKLFPFVIIALFDLAFGLTIAHLVFGLPVTGSIFLLFGFATLYLFGVLGLGLFISTLADTQQQVMFITYFVLLIFILMGGVFTPVEYMPELAQILNRLNPTYYFIRIVRMIALTGSGFTDLFEEFVSLIMIGAAFLSLAIWKYRKTS